MDKLIEALNRIPITFILILFLAGHGYFYYDFMNGPQSPLLLKKKEIEVAEASKIKLQTKLKEVHAFLETLEKKKQDLIKLAKELQGMKETLSDRIDTPTFMKMVITESKKLGVNVLSLKPSTTNVREYYTERNFQFTYRCVFAQLVNFLERLTNVSEIVRVDTFHMKPIGPSRGKYVMLEGVLELKTFTYLGTKADSLAQQDKLTGAGAPGAAGTPSASRVGGTQ